ncbi:MAG: transketolase [Chloroflexota bacterium]
MTDLREVGLPPHAGDLAALRRQARALRRDIVHMAHRSQTAHVGTSLSCADILTVLYFGVMRLRPAEPCWPERDRFIMSKGHGCSALYAALAQRGFFPLEELHTYRQLGSRLQGHPELNKLPGVEFMSGSLGHGLAGGLGMALGNRMDGRDRQIYVLVGDGELQEGLNWEAILAAPNLREDNLIGILDYNRWQSGAAVEDTMSLEPVADKLRAFGWHVEELDGHDLAALLAAFSAAQTRHGQPTFLVCHTVKGKGVPFMEDNNTYHSKAPDADEYARALAELGLEGGC